MSNGDVYDAKFTNVSRYRRRRLAAACLCRSFCAAVQGHRLRHAATSAIDFLPKNNPNLRVVQGDIRDTAKLARRGQGHDAVVNLACISNDASFELDENLSTSVNLDAFEPMVIAAKKAGVKRFIYASSSSVYGVSDQPNVTEEHPLVPLTLYNKYKGMCEPLLWKHTDETSSASIFRPATVCGYAPRQRLDLSVNILTNHADQQQQDHGVRRRPDAPQPAHRRTIAMPSSCC